MVKRAPQLIKYIGNKTKFAEEIASFFPNYYDCYFEPFFGSGALLGALKPHRAVAVDAHQPLIDMWKLVRDNPKALSDAYREKWDRYSQSDALKKTVYRETVDSYNANPNALDFLFISRACYGGVLRYRKADGALSTPVGAHRAIPPEKFDTRLSIWTDLVQNTDFYCGDFSLISEMVTERSLVYCDPPYVDSQKILYGAQDFSLDRLYAQIGKWKNSGAFVALSIDGTKKSGDTVVDIKDVDSVFEMCVNIKLGGSMLKRFQLGDRTTDGHQVTDRLLLTKAIEPLPPRVPDVMQLSFP